MILFRLVCCVLAVSVLGAPAGARERAHNTGALWRHTLDADLIGRNPLPSHDAPAPAFASDGKRVFAVAHETLYAYDLSTGTIVWDTPAVGYSTPAYGATLVVALGADGNVHAFDARGGAPRWHVDPAHLAGEYHVSPGASIAYARGVFLIEGRTRDGVFVASIAGDGSVRWSRRVRGASVGTITAVYGDRMYIDAVDDGAVLHRDVYAYRVSPPGGLIDVALGEGPLAVDDGGAWLEAHSMNGEGSASFGARRMGDTRSPAGNPFVLYGPQADTPATPHIGYGHAALENGFIYGQTAEPAGNDIVLRPIYRYRFAPAGYQTPSIVSPNATWIGGPSSGTFVLEEDDGLWIARARDTSVARRHVMTYDPATTHADLAHFDGSVVYVGFSDGLLVAFDTRTGARLATIPHACPDGWRAIAVHGNVAIAACTTTIAAFARVRAA